MVYVIHSLYQHAISLKSGFILGLLTAPSEFCVINMLFTSNIWALLSLPMLNVALWGIIGGGGGGSFLSTDTFQTVEKVYISNRVWNLYRVFSNNHYKILKYLYLCFNLYWFENQSKDEKCRNNNITRKTYCTHKLSPPFSLSLSLFFLESDTKLVHVIGNLKIHMIRRSILHAYFSASNQNSYNLSSGDGISLHSDKDRVKCSMVTRTFCVLFCWSSNACIPEAEKFGFMVA